MKDFHQTDPENMHYDALVQGAKHFKEPDEGRESMCEAVEKYGDERAIKANVKSVKNLMENMKLTLDQALNALGIQGDERELITKQLQK